MNDPSTSHIATGQLRSASDSAPAFEYPKDSIVSYAQTHEDVLLWRALQKVKCGFYVDVGAHDPTALSVTRAFYEHGWHGINIEPDSLYADKLRKERPRDKTLEVALGGTPGVATLYDFGETGLSTLVKRIADQHMAAGIQPIERNVQITTLALVLDDLGDQPVHFLKIDVEGYEEPVLRGADFAKVRPWIVLIEATEPATSIPSNADWEPLILQKGYEFVYFDGLNRYYIAEEHSDLKRYFSVPVSICDPFRDNRVVTLLATVDRLEREKVQQAEVVERVAGVMADLERDRIAHADEVVRLREVVAGLEREKEKQAKVVERAAGVMADLERDRIVHASEVVRLREVVAGLEREKEKQAKVVERTAGVMADLERDRIVHASEVARLSEVVSEMCRSVMRHEVPRLGNSSKIPIACDVQDSAGLLRIVEAQAYDLVRLRRALQAAQTVSAQRLELLQAAANAREQTDTVLEWVRIVAHGDITRIQDAISDVVERSRWRQLGLRLGLAKRLDWETGQWRSNLHSANEGPVARLLAEVERLQGLLDHMRRSRWRKLGHRLGLTKRLPWESGLWRDPLLLKPFPTDIAQSIPSLPAPFQPLVPEAARPGESASESTSRSSNTTAIGHANGCFLEQCRSFGIDTIFDVGANIGQFAQSVRANGFHGHIVSFEPLSAAHETLVAAAASDPLWDVAERGALGASDSWAEINIAGNSYSSSFLPMLDLLRDAAPQSTYQGTELCHITTLDSYIERTFTDSTTLFGLKIDTQVEVLKGVRRNHSRVKVIICEMSLAPLYAGGPSVSEVCYALAELGYRCVAIGPGFVDCRTGELLQVDGVFVKQESLSRDRQCA